MIASLPMYDRPELRPVTDRYWAAIRRAAGAAADLPDRLTRTDDPWRHWLAPDLALSQTCGLPFRARLNGRVTLIGTPVYDLECAPGHYYSVFVARRDDPRRDPAAFAEAVFAYNDPLSQSGWAAPQADAAAGGWRLGRPVESGGHAVSALWVAEGRADLAALDALSWRLIQRYDPWAGALHAIGRTAPTPGLPYIAARGADADRMAAAVAAALAALTPKDRAELGISGLIRLPETAYLALPLPIPPE